MPDHATAAYAKRFVETCLELDLLTNSNAQTLIDSVGDRAVPVDQVALQRGLLTPADVDIVHSLQNPNDVVPGYRILDLIGRGGMGVVYRAEQLDLERVVALKTILISAVSDPTVAKRFEREAKALARLQHPNIVQALNFGRHQGRYYFAMEYVPGRTCEQVLKSDGIIEPRQVWSIVRQVASGLSHALRQNLIHRDIKPANLLLVPMQDASGGTELVKIADFGLAMFAQQDSEQLKLTTGDKIMGSPAYMSLEQFGGDAVDFRSDIYSLGATAWHLLFGDLPFHGKSVAAIFQEKSKPLSVDPSTLPVKLPDDQMSLLVGLLDPDPNRRPQSYTQLIDAVEALGVLESRVASDLVPSAETLPQAGNSQHPTLTVELPAEGVLQHASVDGDSMAETVSSRRPEATTHWRKWLVAGSSASIVLTVALIVAMWARAPERGPRTYVTIASNTPLFDGVTLSGWDVGGSMVGAWNTVEAPDSSTAIACTTEQGALTRRFARMENPRISLFVWVLPGSGPVDIDFAMRPADKSDLRGTLRVSALSTELGTKQSDFSDLKVQVSRPPLSTVHDRFHVVHIERQPTDWYVFLEEKLVGTLPVALVGEGAAIRLVVHSREAAESLPQAFFSDIQLFALQESGRG